MCTSVTIFRTRITSLFGFVLHQCNNISHQEAIVVHQCNIISHQDNIFVLHQEDLPPWKELSVGIARMEEQEVAVCALNIKTLHIFIFVFEH